MRFFIDGVLHIRHTPLAVPELAANDIACFFQLPDGGADALHTLLADGGKHAYGIIPLLWEGITALFTFELILQN